MNNVWDRVRLGLQLNAQAGRPEVQRFLNWYLNNRDFLDQATARAQPYLYYIVSEVDRRRMPMEVALLPIVESAFRADATSRHKASGLWQFIPGTGSRFGLNRSRWYDGRRDVMASTQAALDYLQQLHDVFKGDWLAAIAAYNCGERNVQRAMEANRREGKPADFWSLNLPRETRRYVPRLLAVSQIIASPQRYRVSLPPVDNKPYLTTVAVGRQMDLNKAADMAGMSVEALRVLNPGFLKHVSDPDGPHELILPVRQAETFQRALAIQGADSLAVHSTIHVVRQGENLGAIAQRYAVTVNEIKAANRLKSERLSIDQELLIPNGGEAAVASANPPKLTGVMPVAYTPPAGGDEITHIVRPGDSLWSIARLYHVSVDSLLAWNHLKRDVSLRLNQEIIVWKNLATAEVEAPVPTTASTSRLAAPVDEAQHIRYEIRTGDSLWTIARRFKVSVEQLCQWNNLRPRQRLQPGDELDIYTGVTLVSDAASQT
ncbi:MAG TPA: LysM peptidoglycan-binding domain-containing protein [Gammaproteobacteria bacterium]|nr:LysM peptidoglycan-binding domain-containing protein [Gammaproteobacteria bacterium]